MAIVALLAYLIASHGDQIVTALKQANPAQTVAVTLLALVALLARTEAVVACLEAMGNRPRRREIHAASSITSLVATMSHYLSGVVRGALLRRVDPATAPTVPQMVMVDASTTLIEAMLVAVLIVASASTLKLAWWIPTAVVLAGVAGLAAALGARRRFAHWQLLRGLDVLGHSRKRVLVALLMMIVIGCNVLRTFVGLSAVGLHPSVVQTLATYLAAGALSSLFAGPGAGNAGAPLLVFGHRSIAAAAAGGLILSGTALLACVVYALPGAPVFLWRWRFVTARGSGPSTRPPPPALDEAAADAAASVIDRRPTA